MSTLKAGNSRSSSSERSGVRVTSIVEPWSLKVDMVRIVLTWLRWDDMRLALLVIKRIRLFS